MPAKSFDVPYRFVVTDADGNVVFECHYSVYSYVYSNMMNNANDTNLMNLVKSMVAYHVAAKDYLSK